MSQPPGFPPPPSPPPGPHGGLHGPVRGRDLLRACWSLLRSDRSLLLLPVISAVFAAVAMAIFFVPGVVVAFAGGSRDVSQFSIYAGTVLGGFVASVIGIFFQAALVVGANERADGGDPTVGSAIGGAFARIGPILGWAAVATVVGTAIRALQRRAGVLGSLIGFLGGMAWGIATFLAIPVVVAEGVGPIEAVKRSVALLRRTWGLGLRSTLRWGLIQLVLFLPVIALLVLGFVLVGQGGALAGLGIALLTVALLAFVVLAIAFAAVGQYARAMLYRYATGRPVPGIDPQLMAGALVPGGRARGRLA